MAVDKLVDSTQLDADLTSVANAIRTKGGTSLQLEFPDEFVSAINAISGGGNDEFFKHVRQLQYTFTNTDSTAGGNVPQDIELYLPRCQNVNRFATNQNATDGGRPNITLHFNAESPVIEQLAYAFSNSFAKTITITGDLSRVKTYNYFISNAQYLIKLDAELDFTSCTSVSGCDLGINGTALTYLRYKANTLSFSQNLNGKQSLDEDSLVSIANGLNESATGQTLTLYNTRKALCDTIMGTVGMDATNTFHVFTKDSGGSVTLTDFITNTKGWTLA